MFSGHWQVPEGPSWGSLNLKLWIHFRGIYGEKKKKKKKTRLTTNHNLQNTTTTTTNNNERIGKEKMDKQER